MSASQRFIMSLMEKKKPGISSNLFQLLSSWLPLSCLHPSGVQPTAHFPQLSHSVLLPLAPSPTSVPYPCLEPGDANRQVTTTFGGSGSADSCQASDQRGQLSKRSARKCCCMNKKLEREGKDTQSLTISAHPFRKKKWFEAKTMEPSLEERPSSLLKS